MGTLPSKTLAQVVERLAARFALDSFIETGTWRGDTTRWAAARFARVESIEILPETHSATGAALRDLGNVTLHLGDSRSCLPPILAATQRPAVFWLDAHKGGGYFGAGDDCPLIDELAAINCWGLPALVLIDDARGFLSPPPPPFDWRLWPDLQTVLRHACTDPTRFAVVFDDVILCVPPDWRDALREELHLARPKL
jgi:hypothetical protein